MRKDIYMKLLLITFMSIPIGQTGCDTTEPPIDNTEPGRRDYVWSIDTISSPPNLFYLFSLWGSSPTNLWAVGAADESVNALWHYDGITWKKGTQRLSNSLLSIYGFDSTDIWTCGSQGEYIFHYDGTSWTQIGFFPYPGYSLTYRSNIWGPKPNEIYSTGFAYDQEKGTQATLLQYDGTKWKFNDLPDKEMSFNWVRKSQENSLLYITAIQFLSTGDVYKIFTYNGKSLNEIYSGKNLTYAYEMNGRIYLSIGKKIYKHQSNELVLWKDFSNTNYLGKVIGRNEKDFFGIASDGLAHYNGTDLETIYRTSLFINDVFVMENDVFMLCENRIIIHGKLKNE